MIRYAIEAAGSNLVADFSSLLGRSMWWEPDNDSERAVRREVNRLSDLLIENVYPAKLVFGVGAVRWAGRLSPLLIVDRRLDPRRTNRAEVGWPLFGPVLSKLIYDLVGPLWRLSHEAAFVGSSDQIRHERLTLKELIRRIYTYILPHAPRPREWIFSSVSDAGDEFRSEFQRWDLQSESIVIFGARPKALRSMGVTPLSARKIGTVGLAGKVNGQLTGFTTAGHVVGKRGSLVSRAIRFLGVTLRVGEIEWVGFHSDPEGNLLPGYDLAVASPANGPITCFEAAGTIVREPAAVSEYAICRLDGAVSGRRWGVVNATLRVGRADMRRWKNCWHVTGQSGWFCKEGDSGALVTLETGAILGTLVGGLKISGWLSGSRMEIGFVQDLRSTVEFADTQHCTIAFS
jgi:hypothetical protein